MQRRRYLAAAVRGSRAQRCGGTGREEGKEGRYAEFAQANSRTVRSGHEWMEVEGQGVSRSVCRGGAVEEGKSVGMIKVPASLSGFRPVRWSRSSATSTPTKVQRLIQHNYMAMPLHATQLLGNAKINCHYIVLVIRTRPARLAS
jgi:hypothetical protein